MTAPEPLPLPRYTPALDLDARTRALCELRGRLLELNVQLEYLRLLLKLGVR